MAEWLAKLREWLELHTNWKSLSIVLVMIAVCAFFGGTVYENWQADHAGLTLVDEASPTTTAEDDTKKGTEAAAVSGEVKVHVVGAVTAAGVYTLPADARVDDAVRAAGATANADLSQLNLAQKLADGQKITVPAVGETAAPTSAPSASENNQATPDALININTATAEQLQNLPNIGEVRAKAIIDYREEHGGFKAIEELQEVSGIGEKTFEHLSAYVTV